MKKFLSLVLALVMTMSLVTVSAGAKEFTDDDAITYGEAIEVISTIGVVDGYADGKFNPTNNLTRQAAAKIICNLVLGPTTAASLTADTAPFPDVPVNGDFAGYITYCAQRGIINGYPDGTFKPGNPLTGYAFMKMLLGALGYNAEIEGYIGDNWSVAVAKQAIGIGLATGLEGDFNGTKTVNREEACLYALNMLQADMVEYGTIINSSVTGNVLNVGTSVARSREWRSSASRVNNIKNDNIIQFAEEYFNKLEKRATTDDFGRPSHTWVYDKQELGSYIDYDKLMTEYTKKVTGKDLFDLIGQSRLDECKVVVYIDGVDTNVAPIFGKDDIKRSNDEKVGKTDKGVLTQVFLDTDAELITVAIINTYLAKAAEDYNEKDEDVDFDVYAIDNKASRGNGAIYVKDSDNDEVMTAELEDFDMVEDVKEDDIYLVTVAAGKIQTIETPEVVADATINGFKKGDWVKTGGTQYDYADTAKYDPEVLDAYDDVNLKDLTYNVFLDPYGYLIGLEQNEDPDQYLFLTGIDANTSNLSTKKADANVIFLDGTMKTVTVDLSKSRGGTSKKDGTLLTASDSARILGGRNLSQLNTWCKYRVNNDGTVYTLTEMPLATNAGAVISDSHKQAQYAQDVNLHFDVADVTGNTKTIDKKHVSLVGYTNASDNSINRVYGNDETVYLNLETADVTVTDGKVVKKIVDDVESVTVGVKNADLVVKNLGADTKNPPEEIYTLYNDKGYIIACVTLDAENNGSAKNYVYVTSDKLSYEEYGTAGNNAGGKKGEETWTWAREVLINGEIKDIYEIGDHLSELKDMEQGEWYEVRFDSDGFITKSEQLFENTNTTLLRDAIDSIDHAKYIWDVGNVETAVNAHDVVVLQTPLAGTGVISKLMFENGTLYTSRDTNEGFHVAENVAVVLATASKDGEDAWDECELYTGTNGLKRAIRDMNTDEANKGFNGGVRLAAILEEGSATTIIIDDRNPDGQKGSSSGTSTTSKGITSQLGITVNGNTAVADVLWERDNAQLASDIQGLLASANYLAMNVVANKAAGTATALIMPLNGNTGAFGGDWRYCLITLNFYSDVKVDGKTYYVPCNVDGEVEDDLSVETFISTKGNWVVVDDVDSVNNYFYVWENDADSRKVAGVMVAQNDGRYVAYGDYVLVNTVMYDGDTTGYYGNAGFTYETKIKGFWDKSEAQLFVPMNSKITVTYQTTPGNELYIEMVDIKGNVLETSDVVTADATGLASATFNVGKNDIGGFNFRKEADAPVTKYYDVKFVKEAQNGVINNVSEFVLASARLTENKVIAEGKTTLTVTINQFDKDFEDDIPVVIEITDGSGEVKYVTCNIADSALYEGEIEVPVYDKNGNISNNVENVSITGYVFGRTYIFTYVIDEIVADCDVTVTVGTATV